MQVPEAPAQAFPNNILDGLGKKEADDAYVHAIGANFVII